MLETVQIIKAGPEQLDVIEAISKQTFIETFADKNTEENMEKYLSENLNPSALLLQLVQPGSEFYLAVLNDKAIGYLKVNSDTAQTETGHHNALEIERVYVLKEFHGKKIGQLLCNKAFQIGQEKKAGYLWLGVWEENFKAIRFYKKYGFFEFDRHVFKLGDDEQQDLMMKLIL